MCKWFIHEISLTRKVKQSPFYYVFESSKKARFQWVNVLNKPVCIFEFSQSYDTVSSLGIRICSRSSVCNFQNRELLVGTTILDSLSLHPAESKPRNLFDYEIRPRLPIRTDKVEPLNLIDDELVFDKWLSRKPHSF